MRRTVTAAAVLLAVAALTAVVVARDDPSTGRAPDLARALTTVPEDTLNANFTDWSGVREELDSADLNSASSAPAREAFVDRAFDADLSALSTLVGSESEMARAYGWSVLDLDWEMYGQSRDGQVVVGSLSDRLEPSDITDSLERLGYSPPADEPLGGGTWVGGTDLVARTDPGLTPALAHVALLEDERLVVASDTASYTARTVGVIRGDGDSLADVQPATQVAVPLFEDLVAVVHAPGIACAASGFGTASGADRRSATQLAEGAGGVRAFEALGFGLSGDPARMRVVMTYSSAAAAADDLDARRRLAEGEAVGQGGGFGERFGLGTVDVQGPSVVLDARPVDDGVRLLSDLATGPLLFAWCGPGH